VPTTGSAPVSVASSSSAASAGGSVINVSSLVSQLVAVTRAPQDTQIANQTAAVTTKITALGTLKGALATFQASLGAISKPSTFNAETAASSDSSVFLATAGADAVSGSYSVAVTTLASAQQLLSKPFAGGSTATVGTGALDISLGGASFTVTLDATNNSVAGAATAINAAAGNTGVAAAVIQGTDGAHLLLSSTQTGAANTIQVAETDTGTGLAALVYGPGNTANYTPNAPPADASFSVAGVNYTSPSNSITNAITGVALTLAGVTAPGASATLYVRTDTATVTKNIQDFVAAYNTLQTALAGLGSYDKSTATAGPMLGDPLLQGAQNQLSQALYSQVGSSTFNTLASIGVTTQHGGQLVVNASALQTALSKNFSAVSQLFSGTGGIAAQLNQQITSELSAGGAIDSRGNTLTKQNTALTDQTAKLNQQMDALTASLTQQYTALNTLLSSLQTTSAYLTQAFAALPTVQGRANA